MATEKFEGQGAVVEITREPNCIVRARVTLDAASVGQSHKKAIKSVNKRISIPGFRKGKAPDATVLEGYPSHVERELKENVIQDAFEKTLKLSTIYPMRKESITPPKVVSCSLEEGAEVTFSYEVAPSVPEVEFSKVKLKEVKKEAISEERVEEIIAQIKRSHATYDEQKERALKEGDFVDLTIHATFEDGKKHPVVEKRRFEVNDEMQRWLYALIQDMKVGEVKEGKTAPNPDVSEAEKKEYKEMPVEVELLGIYTINLPEFNDELAQKVGAKTTDEVLEKVRHNLEMQAEGEQKQKQIELLDEELLSLYPIELPSSIIEDEKRERLKRRLAQLKSMKLQDEEIKAKQKEIEAEVDQEVVRALRLYFLHQQIAKQGKIELTKEELDALLADEVAKSPHLYQKGSDQEMIQRRISQLQSQAYQRKTEEYALGQVLAS